MEDDDLQVDVTPATIYETMPREEMFELRYKADQRDQPTSLYHGQRIIGFRMWKTGTLYTSGHWRAIVILADGTRVEVDEISDAD